MELPEWNYSAIYWRDCQFLAHLGAQVRRVGSPFKPNAVGPPTALTAPL